MKISALDESGKPVDWWFAYKIPKLGKSADGPTATGYVASIDTVFVLAMRSQPESGYKRKG